MSSNAPSPKIKICGLTRPADIKHALDAGADYLGVILAGGPRFRPVDEIIEIFKGVPRGRMVAVVPTGSYVRSIPPSSPAYAQLGTLRELSSLDFIASLDREVGLAAVQLHANPTVEEVERARSTGVKEVWSVVQLNTAELDKTNWDRIGELAAVSDSIVFDALSTSGLGGRGVTFDWEKVVEAYLPEIEALRSNTRIVLAGGLNPDNVGAGISTLSPDIVDVSSGVEIKGEPGVKSHKLITDFIAQVHNFCG